MRGCDIVAADAQVLLAGSQICAVYAASLG